VGERIFFGACNGRFYALDKSSAKLIWEYDITKDGNQRSFHVNPIADKGVLYVGCDYGEYFANQDPVGHLYAFDQDSGSVKWKHRVELGVGSDPALDDKNVFIITIGDELLSIDRTSGRLNWSFKTEGQIRNLYPKATPLVDGQRLYLGSADGSFYALNREDGRPIWKRDLGAGIYTSPAIAGDRIYVTTQGKKLYRLNKESGEVQRSFQMTTGPSLAPVVDRNSLLIQSQRALYAIDADLDRIQWTVDLGSYFAGRFPVLLKDCIIVATQDGRIRCFDRERGPLLWEYKIDDEITGGIGVSGNLIYVGTRKGMVYAMSVK
jgi:outer membrane protein assembly factor BamB